MLKTHQKSLWVLLGAILVGVVIYYSQPKDPVYEGHKLSAWLTALNTGTDPLHRRADEALKTIGTNMIPTLIQWIRLKDSPLKLKLMELINNEPEIVLPALANCLNDADADFRGLAVGAIVNYGEAARSSVPVLLKALKDQEPGVRAVARLALIKIDPEAAVKAGVK